ncbi:hypothetical protein Tco_0234636, partial [Tanacetum coccineum]
SSSLKVVGVGVGVVGVGVGVVGVGLCSSLGLAVPSSTLSALTFVSRAKVIENQLTRHDTESDPEEDPEEYEDDETEDGPVDYPMDSGDDDDGDSSREDADGEDEDEDEEDEDEDEEDEERLAPADSAIVVPVGEHVFPPKGTEPVISPPSTNITIRAR